MDLKDTWKPRVDGVDNADSSAVNEIAEAVIRNEEDIKQNKLDISEKANVSDIYYRGTIDAMVGAKADINNVYYRGTIDAKLGDKADKATSLSGYGITDAYTKTEVDETIGDIEAALLEIEEIADSLIGGDTV